MSELVDVDWNGRRVRIEHQWIGASATRRRSDPPVVVFLHEGLGSVSMWRGFPERFCAQEQLRGFVFSRYGYGASTPKRPDEHWSADYMHRQADGFLPTLFGAVGIDRPWLFGHSDGASIALLHAAAHDAAGVIAVAPHAFVEDVSIASIEQARKAYDEGDLRPRLARHHVDPDSAFRGWNDAWLSPAFRDWNIERDIESITCPVLAVQGEDDEYGTLEQVHAIQRRLPKTRLLVLANCAHSPHRDQPELLMHEAGRFIRDPASYSPPLL